MDLKTILEQPDGFTPPDVTVKIEKVYEYKSGENANGPWSFQSLQVSGGRLKLKGLNEFPKSREGQTVTLRANQSRQHGLTGLKVSHEDYQGKTYHQIIVTNSCKWDWGGQLAAQNSNSRPPAAPQTPVTEISAYLYHVHACGSLANDMAGVLKLADESAVQACFATIMIDTKNRGLMFPQVAPKVSAPPVPDDGWADDRSAPESPANWEDPTPDAPF